MDANNGGMFGAWLMCYGGQYWPHQHYGLIPVAQT
jgi:hypothetical protein